MRYIVADSDTNKRLDVFVSEQLPDISRSTATKLCELSKITVNRKSGRPSHKVRSGDEVVIDYAPPSVPDIDLPILYEDDNCVVINKPAGILTHSKGAFNPEATVATFIAPRLHDLPGERGGIVHRLDRVTSGIIICAKTPEAQVWLQKQFAQRRTKKAYIAVVQGQLEPPEAIIDMPIERNPKHPQTFRVGPNGKTAQTTYKTLSHNDRYSMVELKPHTGRTHQLRVHMSYLRHPIVGDELYGAESANRVFLHAQSLEITLPRRERNTFSSPIPQEFESLLS